MNTSELIDNYITNTLSASEKAAFEKELLSNPKLKQEVDFQKDLISTIQDSERLRLKNRLNNIPVQASNSYKKPFVIAAASVFLLGTASLVYYLNQKEQATPIITATPKTETPVAIQPNTVETTPTLVETTTVENKLQEETIAAENEITATVPTNTEQVEAVTYELQQPNTTFEFDNDEQINEGFSNSPENKLNQNLTDKSNKEIVPVFVIEKTKERKYKYDGENLSLIGNFNEKEPYILIENNNKLYLLFENQYFELKDTKGKISTLNKVTDADIIADLEQK